MDYSLLLGVHYRAPQQLRPPVRADGLPMLAEEGRYQIQSRKLMLSNWSLYD
jgi:1-phosphatidylinositol-4-phosphate 5-kinase